MIIVKGIEIWKTGGKTGENTDHSLGCQLGTYYSGVIWDTKVNRVEGRGYLWEALNGQDLTTKWRRKETEHEAVLSSLGTRQSIMRVKVKLVKNQSGIQKVTGT